LLIDDDPALLPGQVRLAFPAPAHRVEVAESGAEGLARIGARPPDVILLDLGLPDQSGLEVYQRIRQIDARIPVIFITIAKGADAAIEAMKQGAYDYLCKLLDPHQRRRVVGEADDRCRGALHRVARRHPGASDDGGGPGLALFRGAACLPALTQEQGGSAGRWPPSFAQKESAVDLRIRHATEADLPAIVDIYNQSIPAGWSTADNSPVSVADRVDWFRKFDPARRPIWVAEVDGAVVATAYLSSFYGGRPAYDATAEVSVYVATAHHRHGIGRRLKQWVIDQCPSLGVTTLLSMHFDHNEATRRINESMGFQRMGHLTEIALVQGHKRGLMIWALRISPQSAV
jgi:phosphinothricin acetyltransferase